MGSYYSDTHPAIEAMQIRTLRETPGWRKMQMVAALTRASRQLALAGLRQRHPDASPAELQRRLAGLLLGEELATRYYGKHPDRL
ncbi:MAG: hypothetical protein KIT08_09675 [Anaerolineales bacterium]|nr:MAG: hypothetical protein KIT08_09675 [Anaerolineales bacterium]